MMNKLFFLFVLIFALNTVYACPRCNAEMFDELFYGERGNTLSGKEIMAAIDNQINLKQPTGSGFVIPVQNTQSMPKNFTEPPNDFIQIIERDNNLSIPPTSFVPQNTPPTKKVSIELTEGEVYIGQGVVYKGFVTNGMIPGPTIIVDEGDIVEFTVINKGQIPHGASIHAAYTQTSKYLGKIPAGESKTMVFKVTYPGVYMYHCSPGGHAIPMHVIFGQYGMMVVKPKKQYKLEQILNKKPDVEFYLIQNEFYASGKDAVDSKPIYVTFNGKLFRYVEEPIKAKPGDYVRIYFLNVGPNLLSTFHIVGILYDFVYWQGNPDAVMPGGQTVTAGPSDSWVMEFRMPPDEGSFTMLTHAVGSTDRGALGLINCVKDAPTPVTITAEGPVYDDKQLNEIKSKVLRRISPFEPGTEDVDPPQVYPEGTKEVVVKIMGNSFYPKVLHISEGTTVKWINEDIFTYMEGEFGGIHNAVSYEGPQPFSTPLLNHTESAVVTFEKNGDYKYMCAPHPYMRGVIIVGDTGSGSSASSIRLLKWLVISSFLVLLAILFLVFMIRKKITAV